MRVSTFRFLLVAVFFLKKASSQDDEISRWAYGVRSLLKGCPPTPLGNPDKPEFLGNLRRCLQHRAILAVDNLLMDDVIPILDGINFVRYQNLSYNTTTEEIFDGERKNDLEDKETNSDPDEEGLEEIVGNRLSRLFKTHVLKIDLDQVSRATGLSQRESDENIGDSVAEGRRRRHKRKGIMPILMMGLLFLGAIIIPLGFQFLAVLGGKALILAKMALMLSSIQGLKKIATSGVNYGLYHSQGAEGWHERSSHQENEAPIEIPYRSYSTVDSRQ